MLRLTILLILSVALYSCSSPYRCQPSKKSRDYAILKEGSISADYVKTTLVTVQRTMKGNQHLFVTESNDTIKLYLNWRGCAGECYWLHKNYLKSS